MDDRIIAIDGPAGSGKSTAARHLAEAIGYTYLNTGAMYRAVASVALEGGIDLNDEAKVTATAHAMSFKYQIQNGRQRFIVNGVDQTDALFKAALTNQLKPVVNNVAVREELVKKMRTAVRELLDEGVKGVVMEGRDIGTVVFPNAPLKFYIHASLDARTHRRAAELRARGENVDVDGLRKQIQYRDETDKAREVGALIQHEDAVDIDTTTLDEDATLKLLIQKVKDANL
jgi:CMP/dCMP kinase